MVTIQNLEVRFDVEGEGDEAGVRPAVRSAHRALGPPAAGPCPPRAQFAAGPRAGRPCGRARLMLTPLTSASQGLDRAYLEICAAEGDGRDHSAALQPDRVSSCRRRTTSPRSTSPASSRRRSSSCAAAPRSSPPELLVDTSRHARGRARPLRQQAAWTDEHQHASCTRRRSCGSSGTGRSFIGVIESLNITYTLFTPDGVPLRAKLALTLKEYRPAAVQVKERPTASPDCREELDGAARRHALRHRRRASTAIRSQWRAIARGQRHRRSAAARPGQTLAVPRLR